MTDGRRIGLALAGGGPEGAVYEIGALRALEESLDGVHFNDADVFVGVSAGAFIASCLANGITTAQLARGIVRQTPGEHPFVPETFFTPAVSEFVRRGLMLPRLIAEAVADYLRYPRDLTLTESLTRLSRALPVGLFDNAAIREYLETVFALPGRTDDFRRLERTLYVVAADLDSGRAVRFGEPGRDHVPISRAVQASTALPGLYPPVLIDDRYYVDGVLLKTLHGSVALERGVDLLFCVNPIVPVDTEETVAAGVMRRGKLVDRGLPTVLSQTFRTLVHSRLNVGIASYRPRFPGQDILLFEPGRDDYRMFFTNIFSFTSRRQVLEHAYDSMRTQLLERREEIEPALERHGIRLRVDVLLDRSRTVWTEIGMPSDPRQREAVTDRLNGQLDRLERLLASRRRPVAAGDPD